MTLLAYITRHLTIWLIISIITLVFCFLEINKSYLETKISNIVEVPVSIGYFSLSIHDFSPKLVIKDVVISSITPKTPPAVKIKEIRLDINLFDISKAISSATLIGAELSISRKEDGSFVIDGLKAGDGQPSWLLNGNYKALKSEITYNGSINHIDFSLENKDQYHKINIQARSQDENTLKIDMNLQGDSLSDLNGQIEIEGNIAKLPSIGGVKSGEGDFKIRGDLKNSKPNLMKGGIHLINIVNGNNLQINDLKSNFQWKENKLDVDYFVLDAGDKKWLDTAFSLTVLPNKISADINHIDLEEASLLAKFVVTKEQQGLIKQASIRGTLDDVSLIYENYELSGSGKFTGLSALPSSKFPGINNATGSFRGSEKSGVLHLDTSDASILAPDMFREDVVIKRLQGDIVWQKTDNSANVSADNLVINLNGLESTNNISLLLSDGQLFVDLKTSFVSNDVSQAKHYFPTKIMKKEDVAWFDSAFIGGKVTKGDIAYKGKLGSEDSILKVILDVDKLNLSYSPNWPQLDNLVGKVTISQRAMNCDIYEGHSNGLNILQATFINPELGKSKTVSVKGELEGEIRDVIKYLKKTPLDTNTFTNAASAEGKTKVALDLSLPLVEGIMPKVHGVAKFNNVKLNISALNLWINKIKGELKFTETGFYSDTIKATALRKPIKININKINGKSFINVTGNADVNDLQKQFEMPGWELAKGSANYKLNFGLPYPGSILELTVYSDLYGVSLGFPRVLAKTMTDKANLSVKFGLGDKKLIDVNYNDQIKAKIDMTQDILGHIVIGAGEAMQSTTPGIIVDINQDSFDIQDWMGLHKDSTPGSNVVKKIKVHSKNAYWNNESIGSFDLLFNPDNFGGSINSTIATGVFSKSADKIILNMESLDIYALKKLKQAGSTELPLFSLTSENTSWQSTKLGRMEVESERIKEKVEISKFSLIGGNVKLKGGFSNNKIKGRLDVARTGELLDQLGITKDISETSSIIDFNVNSISVDHMVGSLDVNLKNGRILSIEPGLGRLLGFLAVDQWIKRAQLDFGDVYKEGLTFNSINGHFDLVNGIASTKDMTIDAVPAKIVINGDADLINQTVDHIVNVKPKSINALPIAGNILGTMTYLAGLTLTGKDQDGFLFGSQYLVKGPWKSANVIPMHKKDGVLAKTWNSLTDFSWLQ